MTNTTTTLPSLAEQVKQWIVEERSLAEMGDENSYGHLMVVTALIEVLSMIDQTAKELKELGKQDRYTPPWEDRTVFVGDALALLISQKEAKA